MKQGEGLKRELMIEVPADRVKSETDKMFAEVKRSVVLKGFRKGKAPMNLVRSLYAEQVKADVVDELIKDTLPEAVKEKDLHVASRPTLTDLKFGDDGSLVYSATVEVMPEVTTVKYDDLTVSSAPLEVADHEVNEVVEYVRKKYSDLRIVEREAREGDVVVVDLKKIHDPKLVLKTDSFPNSEVDLGNAMTVKEFREQLPGLKVGDHKEIEVKYPADYSDALFAGAELKYLCTVKTVKERLMPEFDDAFAKQTGQAETALELRLKIREDITRQKGDAQYRTQKAEIIRHLCTVNPVLIPDGMVEEYLDSVVEDFKKNYPDVKEEEIRKDYRQHGINSMRWDLLRHTLAEQEKLEVLPADTENWISGFAARNNMTLEQAREALTRSGKVTNLRESLLEDKVLQFLLGKAKLVAPAAVTGKS